jgi:hypothetical protein
MVSTQEQMFGIHDLDASIIVENYINHITFRGPGEDFGIVELVRMARRRV